jgi:hypothetical protein
MCRAVEEMLTDSGDGDEEVAYAVRWSTRLSPAHDVTGLEPILLNRETARYVGEAATTLEQAAIRDLQVEHPIEGIISSLGIDKHDKRKVTMQVEGLGRVSFLLDIEDYSIAASAHVGKRTARVTGRLESTGRGWRGPFKLINPRDFYVLQ